MFSYPKSSKKPGFTSRTVSFESRITMPKGKLLTNCLKILKLKIVAFALEASKKGGESTSS